MKRRWNIILSGIAVTLSMTALFSQRAESSEDKRLCRSQLLKKMEIEDTGNATSTLNVKKIFSGVVLSSNIEAEGGYLSIGTPCTLEVQLYQVAGNAFGVLGVKDAKVLLPVYFHQVSFEENQTWCKEGEETLSAFESTAEDGGWRAKYHTAFSLKNEVVAPGNKQKLLLMYKVEQSGAFGARNLHKEVVCSGEFLPLQNKN